MAEQFTGRVKSHCLTFLRNTTTNNARKVEPFFLIYRQHAIIQEQNLL